MNMPYRKLVNIVSGGTDDVFSNVVKPDSQIGGSFSKITLLAVKHNVTSIAFIIGDDLDCALTAAILSNQLENELGIKPHITVKTNVSIFEDTIADMQPAASDEMAFVIGLDLSYEMMLVLTGRYKQLCVISNRISTDIRTMKTDSAVLCFHLKGTTNVMVLAHVVPKTRLTLAEQAMIAAHDYYISWRFGSEWLLKDEDEAKEYEDVVRALYLTLEQSPGDLMSMLSVSGAQATARFLECVSMAHHDYVEHAHKLTSICEVRSSSFKIWAGEQMFRGRAVFHVDAPTYLCREMFDRYAGIDFVAVITMRPRQTASIFLSTVCGTEVPKAIAHGLGVPFTPVPYGISVTVPLTQLGEILVRQ